MKSFMIRIFLPFLQVYVSVTYKSLWHLKVKLKTSKKSSFWNKLLLNYYERQLRKTSSWIGVHSYFEGEPYFPHGMLGVFISHGASIGKNAIIFQQVTIGSNTLNGTEKYGSPTIGNNVYIGAGAKIIGKIKIGNNCRIGANAVVYADMPDNSVAVAASTRIIQKDVLDNRFFAIRNNRTVYFDDGHWKTE